MFNIDDDAGYPKITRPTSLEAGDPARLPKPQRRNVWGFRARTGSRDSKCCRRPGRREIAQPASGRVNADAFKHLSNTHSPLSFCHRAHWLMNGGKNSGNSPVRRS